jgi:tRNA threonylcarbamoyladenosine biosynthesis protein TsaB
MYVAIRTDTSDTEIYRLDENGKIEQQKLWPAGRTLARDLPGEIDGLIDGKYSDVTGIIVFKGPGSFTGLRIGITVANALAYAENIPIIGTNGEDWLEAGLAKLASSIDDKIVLPEYGAPANITTPKK